MNESAQKIEACLFYAGSAVLLSDLKAVCMLDDDGLVEALRMLEDHLAGSALTLMRDDTSVALATAKEMGEFISNIRREELSKDIGKAGLETLSIVLYHGPVSRAEIDYIRGVNSSFILRALLVRGLIKKEAHRDDARTYVYLPTLELLTHLGMTSIEQLPDFEAVKATLGTFLQAEAENDTDHDL